jgi:sugar phosphate isomerase/epimerase
MLFGVCAKLEQAAQVKAAGFDYIEPPVNAVAGYTEAEFEEKAAAFKAVGLPCPSFSLLYPKTLLLLAPETTDAEIIAYLHKALSRVQRLGGTIAVFGSGKSRNRPAELSYAAAFRRLVEIYRLTGQVAAQYGVTIVAEPLNRGECNMLNSMAEAAALCAVVDHPQVRLLTDYYHVTTEGEPLSDISRIGGFAHAHIAATLGRRYPLTEEGEQYAEFFRQLKRSGYTGNVSIEGKTEDMSAEAPKALARIKQDWEEA